MHIYKYVQSQIIIHQNVVGHPCGYNQGAL